MNVLAKTLQWIEEEALRLLTIYKKATSAVTVQNKSVSVTLTMKRYTFYVGSNAAILTVHGNEISSLTTLTFSGLTTQNGRVLIVERWTPTNTDSDDTICRYRIFVAYGNNDDRDKLDAGQTVQLTYPLTITATANITSVDITYEDVPEE